MGLVAGPLAFWQVAADVASNENARIILEILIIFVSAKLLAEIAERLHQPAVAGELLAGILIGPAVLDLVHPNDLLHALAELGVIFLLFNVGLELDDFELTKLGPISLGVATLGVIVPFAAGWGIMTWMGHPQIQASFLGAAMVATSVGITARVLAAKGLLNVQTSKIILAAAVIDDILGLIVLALVTSMAEGDVNPYELALTAVLAIAFTVVVAQWGQRAMEKIVPKASAGLSNGGGQFSLSIILLLSLSFLATVAGVAAIIGAFLAGMALASSTGKHVETMTAGATELLVPFFLVGIGLNLDVTAFRDPALLGLAFALLVVASVTKLLGCGLPAIGMGLKEATRIGVGMIPRGEVGMVIAQLGLSLGVMTSQVYALVVFMSIGSTLIAPPLLTLAFKGVEPSAETRSLPRVG